MNHYRLRKGVEVVDLPDDTAMIVDLVEGELSRVNRTGLFVLRRILDGEGEVASGIAAAREFGQQVDEVTTHIGCFVTGLVQANYLDTVKE